MAMVSAVPLAALMLLMEVLAGALTGVRPSQSAC